MFKAGFLMNKNEKSEKNENAALSEALAKTLEELRERTCADMVPLWLAATAKVRASLFPADAPPGWLASENYRCLSKAAQSKYRTLAVWRHAVLWKGLHEKRPALRAVYFTPYRENRPPYAYTRSARPIAKQAPSDLKFDAAEQCAETLHKLREARDHLGDQSAPLHELLCLATRPTLYDVLKLEKHDPDGEEKEKWSCTEGIRIAKGAL